ncbi:NUDIX hydrolase [Anaeromyxobacter oryzae]|uniref:Outer membrane protein beta-barrel domain-containing protein n=1 Tax=Anaeromyxobacter oryzae TaxID=2918170 RepID=A0ABM7WT79_9BACT|nr:hypothetical protein [Anaeromyxobacter oryzae]BDG02705.1 hypothetical protein AMOR_17010 [Anaeromyxobacter oryzae]
MTPPRLASALALLLAAAPAAAATHTVALLPTTGHNVPEPQLAAAGDVLRAHLEATGRFVVVRVGPAAAPSELRPVEVGAAARDAGAELGVTLDVSRLEATGVARVAAYAQDGTLVHADTLSVLGADDLDPALARLAEGLATGGPARDLATIETVTAHEERPLRKMEATTGFGLTFVALMPVNRADPQRRTGGLGGLGLTWHYDARDFLADVTLAGATANPDPYVRDEDSAITLGMGVYYPFSKKNVSPYLGAGAAWAWSHLGGEQRASGLQGRLLGGLLMGRLSTVAVKLEVGWFVDAFPERERATGRDVRVQGGLATLALLVAP